MVATDVDAVLELLRAALGEPPLLKRTPGLFAWKHFDNPFGESIALVAESGTRIVGLRAFMRWELVSPAGERLRCVRAVDTATHPDFERRGIFRRLTEEALENAHADNVDLVFNTPNAKSGSGYLSMGWHEVGSIGVLAGPTRRVFSSVPAESSQIDPGPVRSFQIDDREPLGLRTPRSESYLRWRFDSHPTAHYFEAQVDDGIAILRSNVRRDRPELLIADLFGTNLRKAIRRARQMSKARYVATWFSPGSPERSACLRSGLFPLPGVRALTLMVRPLRELGLDVASDSVWDLALSDLELL